MEVLQYLKNTLNGDKQAFNFIINLYEKRLYLIAKSRLDNEHDVKDVIQDTFLYAYCNLDKLRDLEKFNAWITKILINKCNKIHFYKKRIISYEGIEADNYLISETQIKNIEESIYFFDVIKCLNKDEKTLITMYLLDDYTTREMSRILNINESTIRTRISKIKNKIRNNIKKGEKYEKFRR